MPHANELIAEFLRDRGTSPLERVDRTFLRYDGDEPGRFLGSLIQEDWHRRVAEGGRPWIDEYLGQHTWTHRHDVTRAIDACLFSSNAEMARRLGVHEFDGIAATAFIGFGGFGAVLRGHRLTDPSRPLAIKVAHKSVPLAGLQLQHEAKVLKEHKLKLAGATVRVPELVLHSSIDSPVSYLVTTLLEGKPVSDWLCSNPSDDDRVYVVRSLAETIEQLHDRGVVHGDLSPDNVLVRTRGGIEVQLVDFAASMHVLVSHGALRAITVRYSAPELFDSSHASDARSDVWSFGALAYEILTGRHAYDVPEDAVPVKSMLSVFQRPGPRTPLPGRWTRFDDAITRSLRPEPDRRPKASDLKHFLVERDSVATRAPVSHTPTPPPAPDAESPSAAPPRQFVRSRVRTIAAFAMLGIATALGVFALRAMYSPEKEGDGQSQLARSPVTLIRSTNPALASGPEPQPSHPKSATDQRLIPALGRESEAWKASGNLGPNVEEVVLEWVAPSHGTAVVTWENTNKANTLNGAFKNVSVKGFEMPEQIGTGYGVAPSRGPTSIGPFKVVAGRTYTITLRAEEDNSAPYLVGVEFSKLQQPCGDDSEQPLPLNEGEQVAGCLGYDETDRWDEFIWTAPSHGTAVVMWENSNKVNTLNGAFKNVSVTGFELPEQTGTGYGVAPSRGPASMGPFKVVAGKSYTITLRAEENNAAPYLLSLEFSKLPIPCGEDALVEPIALKEAKRATGCLAYDAIDREDVYVWTAPSHGTAVVAWENLNKVNTINGSFKNVSVRGFEMPEQTGTGYGVAPSCGPTSIGPFKVVAGRTYTITLRAEENNAAPYLVGVEFSKLEAPCTEDPAQHVTLKEGERVTGCIGFDEQDRQDEFVWTAPSHGTAVVTWENTNKANTLNGAFKNVSVKGFEMPEQIGTGYGVAPSRGPTSIGPFKVVAGRTYTITLRAEENNAAPYLIGVDFSTLPQPCSEDPVRSLTLKEWEKVAGCIGYDADDREDEFVWTAPSHGTAVLTWENTNKASTFNGAFKDVSVKGFEMPEQTGTGYGVEPSRGPASIGPFKVVAGKTYTITLRAAENNAAPYLVGLEFKPDNR